MVYLSYWGIIFIFSWVESANVDQYRDLYEYDWMAKNDRYYSILFNEARATLLKHSLKN